MRIPLIFFLAISGITAIKVDGAKKGIPISIKQAPFFVSIRQNHKHKCGGAFISMKHVLTAAHCVMKNEKEYAPNLSVMSGVTKYYTRGTPHRIAAVIHPAKFQIAGPYLDIAVLVLSDIVGESPREKRIPLPNNEPKNAQPATLFTFDASPGHMKDAHLRQTNFVVFRNPTICLKLSSADAFCALNEARDKVDPSDLGGPLVQNGAIIGIASWVDKRDNGRVTYYENTRKNLNFITAAMKCMDSSCKVPASVVHPYEKDVEHF